MYPYTLSCQCNGGRVGKKQCQGTPITLPPLYRQERVYIRVLKGTAVSVHLSSQLKMYSSSIYFVLLPDLWSLNHLLQSLAELEHSGAPIPSAFVPLTAVMGHETAQMAVMKETAVSFVSLVPNSKHIQAPLILFSSLTFEVAITYCCLLWNWSIPVQQRPVYPLLWPLWWDTTLHRWQWWDWM